MTVKDFSSGHPHAQPHAPAQPHAVAAARHPHGQDHRHAHDLSQHDHVSGRRQWGAVRRGLARVWRHRFVRRLFWVSGFVTAIVAIISGILWYRLSTGPIEFDIATPWLKAAIEENFGGKHSVAVGGTQLERDEKGRTSLRLRDIVVRDLDGTVVASAPKAEVGLSGASIFSGHIRAESLNLVGAEMAVRIETDGRVTVFAGADKRPIATAETGAATPKGQTNAPVPLRGGIEDIVGLLAWIDGLGASGLDGHDLRELGLKNGNLTVDDQRNGKHWTFSNINVILGRPSQGGVIFRVESESPERPWQLSAAMRPLTDGIRAIGLEARQVRSDDLLLALRLNDSGIESNIPLSASIRAELAPDGTPQTVQGQIVAEAGDIIDNDEPSNNFRIDHADLRFSWDINRRALLVPFRIQSGPNQLTMRAAIEAPADQPGIWNVSVTRGDSVIDPIIFSGIGTGTGDDEGFSINRVNVRAKIDTVNKRIEVEQGDLGRLDTRPTYNVGIAFSGNLDYSGAEPHLAFGVAGTRMPMSVFKRMWPVFVAGHVREWVYEHISGGMVERVVIAGNSPIANMKASGPPMLEEGLSVDIETSGTSLRPIKNLPTIRDADLAVHVTGGNAIINLGRGTVEVAPGRKLNIASGIFEMPDTHPKLAQARSRFRIDGAVPAAAVLLASDALRDTAGISLDPQTSRGNVTAQVQIDMLLGRDPAKNTSSYAISAELTNFGADKLLLGQKIEAALLRVTANNDSYQVKGDVKINGTAGALEFRKAANETAGNLRLLASIDESARNRLGFDFGTTLSGSIPVKVTGRVGGAEKDERIQVEADLTSVKIDGLMPGWAKPAGKSARMAYMFARDGNSQRFDDITIEAQGTTIRGSAEIDAAGEIVSANFPVFSPAEGDKVTLKADRGADGVLRVVMRGDIFDGHNFVKSSLGGANEKSSRKKLTDLDLDVKINTVLGYGGETMRGLDLKLARRSGRIRSFILNAKIGRDTPLLGDLRMRQRDNHQVIYFETDDAGALFRFTDIYSRIYGGQVWVAMDPPTQELTPQVGVLNIRQFSVRGEPGLERVVAGAPGVQGRNAIDFSEMRADFTRYPGKMNIRDAVVRGPVVGATIEGNIDYEKNEMHLRGTFVPFYGLNNMFGQIPVLGMILGGGSNEGLLGITYEATGSPGSPRIAINPVSAIAPGLLRKFIPSPGNFDPNFLPPQQQQR